MTSYEAATMQQVAQSLMRRAEDFEGARHFNRARFAEMLREQQQRESIDEIRRAVHESCAGGWGR